MKNYLFLTFLLISCSSTPEEKVKAPIKEFLHKWLHDPSSYEAVEFGKPDSLFLSDSTGKYFEGWRVIHSYRAKNKLGALVLSTDTFWVDDEYKFATDQWASKRK